MKEFLDLYQLSGCFANLPEKEMEYLSKHKTQVKYYKGEMLFKQGAFAPHVLFVNEGHVLAYLQIGRIKQLNIRILRQGDLMAFSSLFENLTYLYSAVALSDVTLCMIEKEALKKILLRNPDVALKIMEKNCSEENRYLHIINNISYKQMPGKLAAALLYLNQELFKEDDIYELLTRKNIADFAGITVESTVKFLKEFEAEGMLELSGKQVNILDIEKLTNIYQHG
jgi:CRP-like cAMP-binding protein